MATPKFDKLCIDFVKRIPDQLTNATFTPGSGPLPNSYLLSSATIIDYINRAIQTFFNLSWQKVEGKASAFVNLFPEMQRTSNQETFTNGEFNIATPYLDFYKIIGGFTVVMINSEEIKTPIKPKAENLYLQYLSGKYKSYRATQRDPAIIQLENKLVVFPKQNTSVIFHYIKFPLDPTTGAALTQNGNYDNPFAEQWDKEIVNIAYTIWLEETAQTQ